MRTVAWDGRSVGPWAREVDGADAVINLAGEPVAPNLWTNARKRVLRASRIDPTRALVAAIGRSAQRPAVLANASAVGYYGDRGETSLSEEDTPGDDFLARLVVDWEAAAREAATRVALLRMGVVLGPRGGALPRLALPFRFLVGGPIGSGRQWFPWVHVDDVVGAFRFALDHPEVEGPLNVTAPESVRNRDFARALGQALGRPSWLRVPGLALRVAFGELGGALLTGQRVVPQALTAAGYPFQQPSLLPALRQALGARP
jgi:uncharacterized protein (TIGR01777 family)